MGLTYDGITYRSLEEQVRYDAEQVQALKQADVTINENLQTVNESLQTVNTEINGKLTKPANPSAESAVTLLADGTVGTKPLSEIGGGGKLYRHHILGSFTSERGSIQVDIIKTSGMPMSQTEFKSYVSTITVGAFTGMNGQGSVIISYNSNAAQYVIQGAILNTQNTGTGYFVNLLKDTIDSFTDTVTEL